MFQYDNKKDDLNRCSNESEEDVREKYLLKSCSRILKRAKKGGRRQWTEHLANDLVDIILDNDNTRKNCSGQITKILKVVNTTIKLLRN